MNLVVHKSTLEVTKRGQDKAGNDFMFTYKSIDKKKPDFISLEIYEGNKDNGIMLAGATFNQDGSMSINTLKFTQDTFAQAQSGKEQSDLIFAEFK